MFDEAHVLLTTTELPEYAPNAPASFCTAAKLADHLLSESRAVTLGKLGGRKIAERGSDYFRKLAAKRKTHAGGRPRKQQ
jgi:hypothetical protein